MNIIEKTLRYRQVTLSVLALFFILGAYSLLKMPRREDPKISIPQGLVVAYYPGASSTQVEEQLTKPIEECLFKFEEVKKAKTTSSSEDGKSVITVELTENVKQNDVFWNKLRHELLVLKQTQLPKGVVGPIVNSEFGNTEALILGLSGDSLPYDQLRSYAQRLEDELRTIPSVSKVKRDGQQQEEVRVLFSSGRLAQYGISLTDAIRVLQSQNDVYPSGSLQTESADVVFHAKGYYATMEELGNQVIGTSGQGNVVRLKDVATLSRTFAEPQSKVKVAGEDAIIVSVEALAGNNIVDFGKAVSEKLTQFEASVPSTIHLTVISNQPEIVDNNISHFIAEFFIAIVAVIIIIIVMLPLRIAVVAAMAIPMTVSLTLALLNLCGIELQQVSLAALIVVLGLVVDDAIVVADNYVDLLDHGETRWNAAWKSASELVVPILVATLTIIFAFMPMIILTGAIGEFIESLPLTVSIALASSFVVAMVFTPLLCHTFVKKGLHTPGSEATEKSGKSLLDKTQKLYNKVLLWCTSHQRTTLALGLVPLLLAAAIYKFGIRQKFFPSAERNQFVIELWMPTGTPLKTTEEASDRLALLLKGDSRVTNFSTFIGTSAPRFYYNLSPEFPVTNFAQVVINTTSNETTLTLADELTRKVEAAVPEGRCKVRLMQQGKPLKAQVEVRVWGEDIEDIEAIGLQVDSILRQTPGTMHVQNTFHEDYLTFDIRPKPEAARMGFTTESIALSLQTDFGGAPITYIREDNNTVVVRARLEEPLRQTAEDVGQTYLTSPATGKSVPLSQVADIVPVWKTGRVMHRNGMRVMTIESETDDTVLASEVLAEVRPQIDSLPLPSGYQITYGGEQENKTETFGEMAVALGISLLLIFFILLFQFRDIRETLIILATIPLSIFGALVGLVLTGNNFGFTAFVGLICLSGIVVRNSIILIDHIHELVDKHQMTLSEATIESGKRRLRPIFLTAMAAAFGVIPMILSGSQMWSPLASIIAFGVVWSMVVALLLVPVAYLRWIVKTKETKKQLSYEKA